MVDPSKPRPTLIHGNEQTHPLETGAHLNRAQCCRVCNHPSEKRVARRAAAQHRADRNDRINLPLTAALAAAQSSQHGSHPLSVQLKVPV